MALFKRNSGKPEQIANNIPYNPKNPPLTDGTFFTDKQIFYQMPFGVQNQVNTMSFNENSNADDGFIPNFFGRWVDIYSAFKGTFKLVKAPDEIKRHQQTMKHLLFIVGRFAIMKFDENDWLIGNYSTNETDNYGRIIEGSFIPWNYANNNLDDKRTIEINKNNNHLICTMQLGNYGIPLFIQIGYYINLRNMLYKFKNINLRMSVLHKIIGLKGQSKELMDAFLHQLFNLDSSEFPVPLHTIDISGDEKTGDLQFNFTDLENQIDFSVEYKGNEINMDLEWITKELFRVAGIRTDLQSSNGSYSERSTDDQSQQASNYFDVRESDYLEYFENFEYDFKQKFGIDIKWNSIYNLQKENEKESNEELENNDIETN